jgi:Type IV secretion system proteins
MKRFLLTTTALCLAGTTAFAAIPVIDAANLAEAKQITENTQSIMESDSKIMDYTQKTLAAVTGDRTSESGELKDMALGNFKMGEAPDLGSIISGGVLSFAGLGEGSQQNVAKLINAMQLVKSISGLEGKEAKDFDKTYQSFMNVTATLIGLVDSTQGGVSERSNKYTQGAQKIGSAKDLKGSIDQNSQIQAQNGMTMNEMMGVVSTAVTAINQQNINEVSRISAHTKLTQPAEWQYGK